MTKIINLAYEKRQRPVSDTLRGDVSIGCKVKGNCAFASQEMHQGPFFNSLLIHSLIFTKVVINYTASDLRIAVGGGDQNWSCQRSRLRHIAPWVSNYLVNDLSKTRGAIRRKRSSIEHNRQKTPPAWTVRGPCRTAAVLLMFILAFFSVQRAKSVWYIHLFYRNTI